MIYVLQGHDLKHAVEEMLLHLQPTERPVYASEPPEGDCCISRLELDGGTARAQAEVRLDGSIQTAERSASVEGLTGLAQKRVVTEIVKLALYDAMAPRLAVKPAWGSLTGVRPAKLARGLMARGLTRGQTAQRFRERYGVTAERTALTMRAAAFAQAALERLPENEVSLYIGIPFCPSRCAYCSFVSHSIEKSAALIPPYVDALCAELADTGALLREGGMRVSSIYIGGGTPTTLSPDELSRLMDSVSQHFDLSHLQEYTVEAGRPDTITREKLAAIRKGGAGRVSINPQSMNDQVLQNIGRRHTAHEVLEAYALAREIGFDVINMDTIAGLEGDTPESFAHTIDTLIGLEPENITVHTLAIKRGADLTDKGANAAQHDRVQAMLTAANAALSACDVSVLDLFPQEAGQNAVDEFHHLGGLILTGDLYRLTDGHTVGDIRHIQDLIHGHPHDGRGHQRDALEAPALCVTGDVVVQVLVLPWE